MRNIIDYVKSTLEPFSQKPLNPVDSLVFCQLIYLKFERVIDSYKNKRANISALYRAELFDTLVAETGEPLKCREFLAALAASPRFRDVNIRWIQSHFDPDKTKQFLGATFVIPNSPPYIAFRGTDATLVGWKEDFDMAFLDTVPSQTESLKYLDSSAKKLQTAFYVGGHSKGGNLAVYSAMFCKYKDSILKVFNHDGPGFKDKITDIDGYRKIEDRIKKTMPKSSLVGMLLEHQGSYSIVESSSFWVMQHEPFTWGVETDDFIYTDHFTGGANFFNESLYEWLKAMTSEQRALFVNTLFGLAESCDISEVSDLSSPKNIAAILAAVKGLDPESKHFLVELLKSFASISVHNLKPSQKSPETTLDI